MLVTVVTEEEAVNLKESEVRTDIGGVKGQIVREG